MIMPENGTGTPLIKLIQVEENKSPQVTPTTEEESKEASDLLLSDDEPSLNDVEEMKPKEPVSEIFKQRLVAYRKQISKTMVFTDQL